MTEMSPTDALAMLDQVRGFYGLSPSGLSLEQEPTRSQLCEAYPLLCMMVARLRAEPDETERADIKHGWQKALRRRSWDLLPPLGAARGSSRPPASPALASIPGAWPRGPSVPPISSRGAPPAAGGAGPLADQISAFLAMFGVPIDAHGLPLSMWPNLESLVAELRLEAEGLRSGPLRSPEAYRVAWLAIVGRWNEFVGHSALRIPTE